MELLHPPLKLSWVFRKGNGNAPVVAGDLALFGTKATKRCVALDVANGRERWSYGVAGDWCGPDLVRGSEIFVYVRREPGYHVLDVSSGRLIRKLRCVPRASPVAWENLIVGSNSEDLEAIDAETGKTIWFLDFSKEDLSEQMTRGFTLAGERIVFGRENGDIVCIETRTGKEVWTSSVREFAWDSPRDPKPGKATGSILTFEDTVIVTVMRRYVVAFALENGRMVWKRETFAEHAILVGDRLFLTPYSAIDPGTGEALNLPMQDRPSDRIASLAVIQGSFAVSTTHVFHGTHSGYIFSWELATGGLAWYERPEGATGAFGSGVSLTIRGARLYYADTNGRVYCYEEVRPAKSLLAQERAEVTDEGALSKKATARKRERPSETSARPDVKKPSTMASRASRIATRALSKSGARNKRS